MLSNPFVLSVLVGLGAALFLYGIYHVRQPAELRRRVRSAFEGPAQSYEQLELQTTFSERVMQPLLRRILASASRFAPAGNVERLKHDLIVAGNPRNLTLIDFMGLRLVAGLVAAVIAFFLLSWRGMNGISAILFSFAGGIMGTYLPNYWLKRAIKARQREITRALPDALDMLSICVDAGLGFDAALMKVGQRWQNALALEFGRVIGEIRMGARRQEALRNLASRTDVPEVSSFVAVLVQADSLGVSITDVLHAQSEQMRMRRRQWAEEQARKAPLKMLIPLVMCIFPALFAVILGPAVPRIVRAFGNM
ncbi:MAG: type II secretion system F family protein [Anaerolineae bacterium]